ncbi:methyltransferase RsmF C-terminal domain-like protein [Cecembia rubra]|uniref:methyltransferase RsmF C-terminal domain-like protein n=1 Tax=Cecembia rubra TaxID=1485585 RepID=UPI002714EAA9|nr:tRNA/rRNA cytosine-C5-methylase [Cecembia rubra]
MSSILLPEAFEKRMKDYLGEEEFSQFHDAMEKDPRTSIRLNPFKNVTEYPNLIKVPWSTCGYYLVDRPSFTLDPLFHAGAYYVQEASSMFLDHILNHLQVPKNGVFLDLAAAPGGKSTLLSSYLGEEGFLIANEVIKTRASILKENIIKWGLANTLVTQNDPEHFSNLEGFFDLVLVDAPCSGEGMFRKDPDARNEWSPEHVNLCAMRQERIMDQAGALVKAGGYLVYSTCTFNVQENEDMLRFICSEFSYEPVRIPLVPSWGIVETTVELEGIPYFGYRFYPHKVEGEGFFVCVLKRSEDAYIQEPQRIKDFKHPFIKSEGKAILHKLVETLGLPENSSIYSLQGSFFRIPTEFQKHFEFLSRFLNIKYFGVELGKFNKEQFVPTHELAVSILPKHGFKTFELSKKEALDFLRKEEIPIPGMPEGWVLVTFQNLPLGWVKNLGKRTNNNYPKEWRIRMR